MKGHPVWNSGPSYHQNNGCKTESIFYFSSQTTLKHVPKWKSFI